MDYYKVIYWDREKLPDGQKGEVIKVCFEKNNKKEYLYLKNGKFQTKSGDKSYSFCIEKKQVLQHKGANKIVKGILHQIR